MHEIAVRSRNCHLVAKPANPAKRMLAHKALKLLDLRIRRTARRSLRIRNTPAQLGQIQQLDSHMVLELVAGAALRQPRRPLRPRSAILRRARNRTAKQSGQIMPKRRVKPNRFRAIHGAEQAVPEKRVQLPQSSPLIAIQHSHIKLPCYHESLQPYAISRRIQHPAALS